MTHLWCNGQWLDANDFPASPSDRGLTLGLGLFETILAIDGEPVFAELHQKRLRESCARLAWHPNLPDFAPIMKELMQRAHHTTGRTKIRLAITSGTGSLDQLALGADHLIWMSAAPVDPPPPTITANLSPWTRNQTSPLAGLKCASYAENLVALDHAARLGFGETLFLNTSGHLCEAATANLFLVKHGKLSTPPAKSGCLLGIARGVVIGLAQRLGIPCDEASLSMDDLHACDELFLTSSIRGLIGVSRFERRLFPLGPLTDVLREAWNSAIHRKICG